MKQWIVFMEQRFLPIMDKIGSQRHIVSIRDSFMTMMPLMVMGAFATTINNLPIPMFQTFMNELFGGDSWKAFGVGIWNGSFAIIALGMSFLVAYFLTTSYGEDGVIAGIISMSSFFVLGALIHPDNINGLGQIGLFIAMIVALGTAEIFRYLIQIPRLTIKLSLDMPEAVRRSFAALPSAFIIISLFALLYAIFYNLWTNNIIEALYNLLQQPLMNLDNSYLSAIILAIVGPLLWFFGLHGGNLMEPVMQIINAPAIGENVRAIQANMPVTNIINKPFFDAFINLGGIGATFGLVLAILIVGHRSRVMMTVAQMSVIPGVFNINEPTIFGLPIILNPIMFVPFVFTPVVLVTISYFVTKIGWVPPATVMIPWQAPPIIGGVIATASIQGGILSAVNLVISTMIYIPFVDLSIKHQKQKELEIVDSRSE